jgi:hypothetical protein
MTIWADVFNIQFCVFFQYCGINIHNIYRSIRYTFINHFTVLGLSYMGFLVWLHLAYIFFHLPIVRLSPLDLRLSVMPVTGKDAAIG